MGGSYCGGSQLANVLGIGEDKPKMGYPYHPSYSLEYITEKEVGRL